MTLPVRYLLAAFLGAALAPASTGLVVTTLQDQLDEPAGAERSLREALRDATGEDVITFAPALSGGMIMLDGSELLVAEDLTIDASTLPDGIVINANDASRVLTVAPGVTAALVNLTVTGGSLIATQDDISIAGAGIRNEGSLFLDSCTITDNTTTYRGGGIYSSGARLTLNECTITDNRGARGAGIYTASAATTITATTIARNSGDYGSGLHNQEGKLQVMASTICDNDAFEGGAVRSEGGSVDLRSCTLTANTAILRAGGVLVYGASLTLDNCIVANNPSGDQTELFSRSGGSIGATAANLIGSNKGVEALFPASALAGEAHAPLDPLLAPLAHYGGATMTRVPVSGSPALDAVARSALTPPRDQRGVARPIAGAVDLGAVEVVASEELSYPNDNATEVPVDFRQLAWTLDLGADRYDVYFGTDPQDLALLGTSAAGSFPVSDLAFATTYYWRIDSWNDGEPAAGPLRTFTTKSPVVVTGIEDVVDPTDGVHSLREAILAANAAFGHDRIEFDPALDGGVITLRSDNFEIDSALTIDASVLSGGLTVSGGHHTRVFRVRPNSRVLLRGFTIRDAYGEPRRSGSDPLLRGSGGAIFSSGTLTLEDMVIRDNVSEYIGAGVASRGPLVVRRSMFINNISFQSGGAIHNYDEPIVISDSHFTGNTAYSGAAITHQFCDEPSRIERSTITGNRALDGGGILINGSPLLMTDSTIARNLSGGPAGGIWNTGDLRLVNVTVTDNATDSRGGGIFNEGTLSLVNVTVARNTSNSNGAGIYFTETDGSLHLQECIVADNNKTNAYDYSKLSPEPSDIYTTEAAPKTAAGRNLIGSNERVEALFPEGPLTGTLSTPLNALLSPLGNHGGPTPTCVPLASSPAIDAGDPEVTDPAATDQRGLPRPAGTASDLGAVELAADETYLQPQPGAQMVSPDVETLVWPVSPGAETYEIFFGTDPDALSSLGITAKTHFPMPALDFGTAYHWRVDVHVGGSATPGPDGSFTTRPALVVTSAADRIDPADGLLTLREAVQAANDLGDANLVRFAPPLNGQTILLTGGALAIDSSLTIDASSLPTGLVVSGNNQSRVFEIAPAHDVWLRNLTIADGLATAAPLEPATGGGVLSAGDSLRLTGCHLRGNNAPESGGALYDRSSHLIIEETIISDNQCGDQGGGLFTEATLVTFTKSDFSRNVARLEGGGAFLDSGTHNLTDSTFRNNTSLSFLAGGAHAEGANSVSGCHFLENDGHGASLNNLTISSSHFLDNSLTGLIAPSLDGTGLLIRRNGRGGLVCGHTSLSFSRITDNASDEEGGGIHCTGATILTDCTIADNSSADDGGGIAAAHDLEVIRCTVSHNTASNGGGVWTWRNYGTIITNSTIVGNQAATGGGIYHDRDGALDLRYSTVTGNSASWGGGITLQEHLLTLENSIVAKNTAVNESPDIRPNRELTVTVLGRVLIGNNESVTLQFPAGPLVGTSSQPLDPLLGAFGLNGGITRTMVPLPGSPALDAGTSATNLPETDQRGSRRPAGPAPDLGAIELDPQEALYFPALHAVRVSLEPLFQWPSLGTGTYHLYLGTDPADLALVASVPATTATAPRLAFDTTYYWRVDFDNGTTTTGLIQSFTTLRPIVVTSTSDEVVSDGETTLREAVAQANANSGYDLIVFASSLDGTRIDLTSQLVIDSELEIDASELPAGLTVAGTPPFPGHRLVLVSAEVDVTLHGMTLTGGRQSAPVSMAPNDRGGAIYSLGDLALFDMVFAGNSANTVGGAVAMARGTSLQADRCTFIDNQGSALDLDQETTAMLRDTRFERNRGGAIGNSGDLTIERCLFTRNSSDASGGAIYHNLGTMVVRNSTFAENHAEGGGGAIYKHRAGSPLTVDHCTLVGNEAGSSLGGGGIYVRAGTLTLTNSIVANNLRPSTQPNLGLRDPDTGTIVHNNTLLGNNLGVEEFFPEGPLTGTAENPLDPRLAPLGDYGGFTSSMPPLPGSPVIDAGSGSLPVDQRGLSRPFGALPDLGAVELTDEIFLFTDQPSALEGNSGTTSIEFTVVRPASSTAALDLDLSLVDPDHATDAAVPNTVSFTANARTATFTLEIQGDTTVELDEIIGVKISKAPAGVALTGPIAFTRIENDDQTVVLIDDVTVTERDDVPVMAEFQIRVRDAVDAPVAFRWYTSRVTTDPSDFEGETAAFATLTGDPDQPTSITIRVWPDDEAEANEVFRLVIDDFDSAGREVLVGATGSDFGVGTILNDDFTPIAADDSYMVPWQLPFRVDAADGVLANDTDADTLKADLSVSAATSPQHGTLELAADGSFVYTPAPDYSGPDSFTYLASDGTNQSLPGTVSLEVDNRSDLRIAVLESRDPVIAGFESPESLVHEVSVTNLGPAMAMDVEINLSQASPPGVLVGTLDFDRGVLLEEVWLLPSLEAGETQVLRLSIDVPESVAGAKDAITTVASLQNLAQPDTNAANDSATQHTSIVSARNVQFAPLTATPVLDETSGELLHTIRLTNNNPQTVFAYSLLIGGLPADVTVLNGTGGARHYGNTPILPSESLDLTLRFTPSTQNPDFTPSYSLELYPEELPPAALHLSEVSMTPAGTVQLEWTSNPGRHYTIQVSGNLDSWTTVATGIPAQQSRTEWIDDGPPGSPTHPSVTATRYYRVLQEAVSD